MTSVQADRLFPNPDLARSVAVAVRLWKDQKTPGQSIDPMTRRHPWLDSKESFADLVSYVMAKIPHLDTEIPPPLLTVWIAMIMLGPTDAAFDSSFFAMVDVFLTKLRLVAVPYYQDDLHMHILHLAIAFGNCPTWRIPNRSIGLSSSELSTAQDEADVELPQQSSFQRGPADNRSAWLDDWPETWVALRYLVLRTTRATIRMIVQSGVLQRRDGRGTDVLGDEIDGYVNVITQQLICGIFRPDGTKLPERELEKRYGLAHWTPEKCHLPAFLASAVRGSAQKTMLGGAFRASMLYPHLNADFELHVANAVEVEQCDKCRNHLNKGFCDKCKRRCDEHTTFLSTRKNGIVVPPWKGGNFVPVRRHTCRRCGSLFNINRNECPLCGGEPGMRPKLVWRYAPDQLVRLNDDVEEYLHISDDSESSFGEAFDLNRETEDFEVDTDADSAIDDDSGADNSKSPAS